jgi:CRP-like cAMP-binding protein
MATIFSSSELPGHFAYFLLAISYWLTSIYWLRILACFGLGLEILYFIYAGGNLKVGIAWSLLFIAINLYQLALLVRERMSNQLPPNEAELLRTSLMGLRDADIAKLLKAADWKNFQPGEILTRQDAPLDSLYFMCEGRAIVEVNGTFVTYLDKGAFIGEIAYLTGNPATARVTIDEPSRVLVFNKMKMAKVVASDEHINGILYQVLGRDLAMKMRRANTRRVLQAEDSIERI